MKKTTVLSLATAGAIVATSIGTFAVWDQLEATSNGSITVANKSVTVTTNDMTLAEGTNTVGANQIDYTGEVTFTIENQDELGSLSLAPTLSDGANELSAEQATITLTQDADTTFKNNTDTTLEATNTYNVKVTVLDQSLKGKALSVAVHATGAGK